MQQSRRWRLWGDPWIPLCEAIRDLILGFGGQLREIFESDKETIILICVTGDVLAHLLRSPEDIERFRLRRLMR